MTLWQEAVLPVVLLLVLAPLGRLAYVRFYLNRRLFFEPWINLSKDEQLGAGDGLAELLMFELNRLQSLLYRARTDGGLWNENTVALPHLERTGNGYPNLVKDVEDLGLPGRLTKLLVFILRAKPLALRGSVQKYGGNVRLQLNLDGVRRHLDVPRANEDAPGASGRTDIPTRAWVTTMLSSEPEKIPAAVGDLAHQALRDLCGIQGFKSADAFRAFASALQDHLEYNSVKRATSFDKAVTKYKDAIAQDGSNVLAACNLGDLLYVQYTDRYNDEAIERYQQALNTANSALRARAFRGLANAYCQKYQRYRHRERPNVDSAVRFARMARQLCKAEDIHANDVASILKAEAYAHQVFAEQSSLSDERRRQALDRAAELYQQAIERNKKFAIAHNNLGYLHLESAKGVLKTAGGECAGETLEIAVDRLNKADRCCDGAVGSDPTFYMSYDNKGNVARHRARLGGTPALDLLESAIESFHEALTYNPAYQAAWTDLAKAHVQVHARLKAQHDREEHADLAWHYHWQALSCIDSESGRGHLCNEFMTRCKTDWPSKPATSDLRAQVCTCAAGVAL